MLDKLLGYDITQLNKKGAILLWKKKICDIKILIKTFNLAKYNKLNIEGIAKQIALLATEQVDNYFFLLHSKT